ncbi:hypothetical protein DPMN_132079 [Dreissena polymorpha]|uniref:HTH psq-type domain-containing protein n=1 Tax=Dreissena polymorpha TaxID=45954 RepID=A0A9D4J8J6_DREPO|nr:hypothetical protein DPMN_132079 [Dreissena polymorpha]
MRNKQPVPQKNNARKRKYNPESLLLAYKAVKEKGLKIKTAARNFGVPTQTLRDCVKGLVNTENPNERWRAMTQEEEETLIERITTLSQLRYVSRSQGGSCQTPDGLTVMYFWSACRRTSFNTSLPVDRSSQFLLSTTASHLTKKTPSSPLPSTSGLQINRPDVSMETDTDDDELDDTVPCCVCKQITPPD